MEVTFVVSNKYSGGTGDTSFTVPMYNQDYSIEYTSNEIASGGASFTEAVFPEFKLAFTTQLIERHTYNWSGLQEDEIDIFKAMLKQFNNSWQPFTMNGIQFIIEKDPTVDKDHLELYSITLNLIKL